MINMYFSRSWLYLFATKVRDDTDTISQAEEWAIVICYTASVVEIGLAQYTITQYLDSCLIKCLGGNVAIHRSSFESEAVVAQQCGILDTVQRAC